MSSNTEIVINKDVVNNWLLSFSLQLEQGILTLEKLEELEYISDTLVPRVIETSKDIINTIKALSARGSLFGDVDTSEIAANTVRFCNKLTFTLRSNSIRNDDYSRDLKEVAGYMYSSYLFFVTNNLHAFQEKLEDEEVQSIINDNEELKDLKSNIDERVDEFLELSEEIGVNEKYKDVDFSSIYKDEAEVLDADDDDEDIGDGNVLKDYQWDTNDFEEC